MEPICVYMTVPTMDVARQIGRVLIDERLAACVNILPEMESMYQWDGLVQQEQEVVLVAKTRDVLMEDLTQRVVSLHPYEVPCIVSWPIVQGFAPFLRWIEAKTGAS